MHGRGGKRKNDLCDVDVIQVLKLKHWIPMLLNTVQFECTLGWTYMSIRHAMSMSFRQLGQQCLGRVVTTSGQERRTPPTGWL